MQFYLNGFRTGDPEDAALEPGAALPMARDALPTEVDVLIVGCGPAGLTLAAQLAVFPEIRTCIVEQKCGPLKLGQADGVACRTMEMFNAFGFAERVLREACWVNETSFWRPASDVPERIVRSGRIKDTQEGLSEFPHVILNQARLHEFYLDLMRKAPARIEPFYNRRFVSAEVHDGEDATSRAHPVTVCLEETKAGEVVRTETVRARYVVGCDGGRSAVRKSLDLHLRGDTANQAWGVMDLLVATDFPDIRMKAVISSAEAGSLVLIPREGGYMVRFYVEMDELDHGERISTRKITVEDVIARAQKALHPYTLDVKQVAWWSVYEIGQRMTDRFDDVPPDAADTREPHMFIAGDACHTHSPKAGQGMNVSMQDAFNLGWKLAAVLRGRSDPALLRTYSAERRSIAQELIQFDREWASLLSAPLKSPAVPGGVDPAEVQAYFVRSGQYTAGTGTRYVDPLLTPVCHDQSLAAGFPVGRRFHSAPVLRVADAKPLELGHVALADGRWRLYAFADPAGIAEGSRLNGLCDYLFSGTASPVVNFTPPGDDVDSVIDVRGIVQQPHIDIDLGRVHPLLLPVKGSLGLRDYEKLFSAAGTRDIFDERGIDRQNGCVVIVRPDQYVSAVLPLDAHAEIGSFFATFMNAVSGSQPR